MRNILKHFLALIFLIILLSFPVLVLADSQATNNLKNVGQNGPNAPFQPITKGSNDLAGIVGTVIEAFLGLLGVLFLVYILYAGYSWMTAGGDEEKVKKAKETLTRAVIGLIIIIAAYSITYYVFRSLPGGGGNVGGGSPWGNNCYSTHAVGW